MPISVGHYGNTSAVSTLILLDEDRRAGRVNAGDLITFLWVDVGNGAMNGYQTGRHEQSMTQSRTARRQ